MLSVNLSLFILTIFLCGYYYVRRKYSVWSENGIPSMKPSFPYGNIRGIGVKYHLLELTENYYKEWKGKVKVFGMYAILLPIAIITDINLIKLILVKDFNNFTDRGMIFNEKKSPLSGHLFNIEGKKWKDLRAKLTPTFTSGKLKMLFPAIKEIVGRLEIVLDKEIGDEIEIKDIFARFTTDIIGVCAFGIECNSLENPDNEFRQIGRRIFVHGRNLKYFMILSFKSFFNKTGLIKLPNYIESFYTKMIRDTIDYREKNDVQKNDFVNLLMQLKDKEHLDDTKENTRFLTFNEMAAQAFVFFIAGFETSSQTLSYCLYELATNPDLQEKARKHVQNVLGDGYENLNYDKLSELSYIEMIINETLRKHPVGTSLWRETIADYKIEGSKMILPKNSIVYIPIYAIHHDPEFYPKPNCFDPERFSEKETSKRPFGHFMPFGEGPRNCIGLRFAMMQMKITLPMLLTKYRFSVCSKTEIPLQFSKIALTLSPANGVWLTVEKI